MSLKEYLPFVKFIKETPIILLTKRTRLRFLRASDLAAVHALHSLPETNRYNTLGIPKTVHETEVILNTWVGAMHKGSITNYTFVIENQTDQSFIGIFGFKLGSKKYKRAEVWYKIHPYHWNQGYATEALRAVLPWGFDTLKLHRIEAGCAVENKGSIRVLEKVGMTREGRCRQILPLNTGWSDNFEYAILETDPRT